MVIAMQWVQQITSISMEMVLPAGLGYWVDSRWGTSPWLLITGAILGLILAMTHLMQLAKRQNRRRSGQSGPNAKT